MKQLHKLIGCPAPLTAVQVGGGSTTPGSDVFFLDGDKKVHTIRRVMAAETQQEVGQAVSLPIQDMLDTINIDHIDKCRGDVSQRALHPWDSRACVALWRRTYPNADCCLQSC